MVSIHVGVEIDEMGLAMAWAQEYFGCTSHGKSQEEAVRLLPDALRAFWSWLRAHGEPDVPEDDVDIVIQEIEACQVESRLADGDSEGSFAFDRQLLTPTEFQRALRYMSYARADVVALAQDVDRTALQREVGRSSRSVGATLGHLALTDLWYAQRASEIGNGAWETYLLERLRDLSVDWLQRSLDDEHGPAGSSVGPNAWGHDGRPESWTLGKTLRRYVWHDLLHTRAMRRALQQPGSDDAHFGGRP